MARVNKQYVERKTVGKRGSSKFDTPQNWRNWWLVTATKGISIGHIRLPKEYVGKRIRLRVEVIE